MSGLITTTLTRSRNMYDTYLALSSTANLPLMGVLSIDRVNAYKNLTPSIREFVKYKDRDSQGVGGVERGILGTQSQWHSTGAIVELLGAIPGWKGTNIISSLTRGVMLKRWFKYKR